MKKLLALVMALVMVMSLSVVSVSADFADAEDIDHTEAVEVMNALGIIGGKENNNYDPNGNVKRSEMAKMVTIALLGDVDPSAFAGAASDLTDISGHWAEGYIKYCVSQGIVAGRGNGLFDPEANVTTAEAAKMLLVALGYNSTVRQYTGSNWTLNVMRDAQNKGLLDELTKSGTNIAMDRDDAAQMIYNTLTTTRVIAVESYNSDGSTSTQYQNATDNNGAGGAGANVPIGKTTLLGETFNAHEVFAYLTDVDYDSTSKKFTYDFETTMAGADIVFGADIPTENRMSNTVCAKLLKSETDYSELYGQKVSVVYELKGGKYTLLGIYGQGKTVAAGVIGQFDQNDTSTSSVKLNSVVYNLDPDNKTTNGLTDTYVTALDVNAGNPQSVKLAATLATGAAATQKLLPYVVKGIDNDDDGLIDVFVYDPFVVAKVTYAGSTSIVAGGVNFSKATGEEYFAAGGAVADNRGDDDVFANGEKFDFPTVAKGDFVKLERGVSGAAQKVTVVEPVNGKVTGEKNVNTLDITTAKTVASSIHQVQVDGTWYYDTLQSNTVAASRMLNNTYDFIVVNGFFFDADEVSSASKEVLLVEGTEPSTSLKGATAKVMFTDGTVETITVTKLDGTKYTTIEAGSNHLTLTSNTLYTYTKASDGTYELNLVNGGNLAGNDAYSTPAADSVGGVLYDDGGTSASAKLDNKTIADDAVIFIKDKNDEYSIITGAVLKGYSVVKTSATSTILSKGGSVKLAYLPLSSGNTASTMWAYVESSPYQTRYDSNNQYWFAKVWTADGEKEVYVLGTSSNASPIARDGVYGLNQTSNGGYEVEATHTSTEVAITKWNSSDKAITAVIGENGKVGGGNDGKLYSDAYKITSSTVVLNANTKDHVGVSGDEVAVANREDHNAPITNAKMVVDQSDGSIKAIVVDTANNWANASKPVMNIVVRGNLSSTNASASWTAGTYQALVDTYSIGFDNGFTYLTGADNTYVVAGDVITYTVSWKVTGLGGNGNKLTQDVYMYTTSLSTVYTTFTGVDFKWNSTGLTNDAGAYNIIPATTVTYATGKDTIAATVIDGAAGQTIIAPVFEIAWRSDGKSD